MTGGVLTTYDDAGEPTSVMLTKLDAGAMMRLYRQNHGHGPTGRKLGKAESIKAWKMHRQGHDLAYITRHFRCSDEAARNAINRVEGGRYGDVGELHPR